MQELHALKYLKKLFTHCQLWWHYGPEKDTDVIFAALLRFCMHPTTGRPEKTLPFDLEHFSYLRVVE